ncbi:DUF2585 family protein [Candidatus Kaiserbacteria bacterium]|nr:DUF2585 family protein [Candidatus Kaiserbacteria bacterium]
MPHWSSLWRPIITMAGLLLVIQVVMLHFYGQPTICRCGYVELWQSIGDPDTNSQQIIDWYTFSHVVQGLLFYFVLWYFFPKIPMPARFLIVVGGQFLWEVIENTPLIIHLYQLQAVSKTYMGDSIVNSFTDTLAVAVGFALALRLPPQVTILIGFGIELAMLFTIRDDLLLNTVNFVHQFDFIRDWQLAGYST